MGFEEGYILGDIAFSRRESRERDMVGDIIFFGCDFTKGDGMIPTDTQKIDCSWIVPGGSLIP